MIKYYYQNWHPKFKCFKSPRPLQIIFQVCDFQGDGFMCLTVGILWRSVQLTIPFPGDAIKFRCDYQLIRSRLK